MTVSATPTEAFVGAGESRRSWALITNVDQDVADAYADWALLNTRGAAFATFSIRNTDPVSDSLKYKIQGARIDFTNVTDLTDGDFEDVVSETTLATTDPIAKYSYAIPAEGFSAMRLQLKNATGGAAAKATTSGKVSH